MRFFLPRRHRRKLLFPPGLLALAGLLWLGCLALRPWQETLRKKGIVQLTMLPLHPGPIWEGHPLLLSALETNRFRPWRDVILEGRTSPSVGQLRHEAVTQNVRAMMADSAHAGGVRIHFAPSAQYSDLIFVLDLMMRENVKQYWLDNQHNLATPTRVYAFTPVRLPVSQGGVPEILCGGSNSALCAVPVSAAPLWVHFNDLVTSFWKFTWVEALLEYFQHSEWRGSLWLLALIAGLSSGRMWRFGSVA